MPMAWPTGAPTRLGRSRDGLVVGQLADLAAQGAVRVHDALGVGRRARGVADDRRAVGVDVRRAVDRLRAAQVVEAHVPGRVAGDVAHHHDVLEALQAVAHRGQVGQVVALPDTRHDDERPGAALAEDEAELLGPVEVHDRHQRHAEHAAGVEGDGRVDPVGQLEGHHVARPEPERAQARRRRAATPRRPRRPSRGTGSSATKCGSAASGPPGGQSRRNSPSVRSSHAPSAR